MNLNLGSRRLLGALALSLVSAASANLQAATLSLNISPIKVNQGEVRIAIFDSESAFDNRTVYRAVTHDSATPSLLITIDDLPEGEYAVMVYQDLNVNGTLDRNLLRIPREPWGGSFHGRRGFGPPSWKKVNFTLADADLSIDLTLD